MALTYGDISVDEGIKLYNADCNDIINNFKGVDLVFTSPPYNRKRNDKYNNYDDTLDDYYAFLVKTTESLKNLNPNYIIINLQANYYNRADVYKYIGNYNKDIQNIIIWEKSNPLPASGHSITNAYEFFVVIGKKALKSNTTYTKNHITTSVNSETTTKIHKAVMKQEVSDWFIEKFANKGDKVLDCFMGLGTTGVSCMKYGVDFIGIERDKTYFDIAKQRIYGAKE